MTHHKCYCGQIYACEWCGTSDGFVCPTVNSDEDANLCSACLDKFFKEYQAWCDDEDATTIQTTDATSVSDTNDE